MVYKRRFNGHTTDATKVKNHSGLRPGVVFIMPLLVLFPSA